MSHTRCCCVCRGGATKRESTRECAHAHTHTHTRARARARTHTHTHTQALSAKAEASVEKSEGKGAGSSAKGKKLKEKLDAQQKKATDARNEYLIQLASTETMRRRCVAFLLSVGTHQPFTVPCVALPFRCWRCSQACSPPTACSHPHACPRALACSASWRVLDTPCHTQMRAHAHSPDLPLAARSSRPRQVL
jgi:hypothetical protein